MTETKDPALNALKHGLLARAAVVTSELTRDTQENQAAFAALVQELVDYYAPDGPVEEMLVEDIAVAYWRKYRILLLEGAMIASNMDGAGARAVRTTESIEKAADELWDRAAAIRKSGTLTRVEHRAAREFLGRPPVDPEEWASLLETSSRMHEAESNAAFNRKVQFHAGPDFSEPHRWDLMLRYDKQYTNLLHKTIDKLLAVQAQRLAEGDAAPKKQRRGRSKVSPQFGVVMGGRR